MRRPMLIGGVAVAATSILLAAQPALAATWTVTPGGTDPGTSGTVTFTDTSTGVSLSCASSSITSSWKSGSGLPGTAIAEITGNVLSGCTLPGVGSMTVTSMGLPWAVNAVSYSLPTTSGTVTGIKFHTTSVLGLCSFDVGGPTPGSGGTVTYTYTNVSGLFMVLTSGSTNLHIYNVSGICLGLYNNGDALSLQQSLDLVVIQHLTMP